LKDCPSVPGEMRALCATKGFSEPSWACPAHPETPGQFAGGFVFSGYRRALLPIIVPKPLRSAQEPRKPLPIPQTHSRLVGRSCGGFGEPEKRKERSGVVKGVSAAAGEHTAKRTLDDATSDLCWQGGAGRPAPLPRGEQLPAQRGGAGGWGKDGYSTTAVA
jgi:hypothetical protein